MTLKYDLDNFFSVNTWSDNDKYWNGVQRKNGARVNKLKPQRKIDSEIVVVTVFLILSQK